MVRVSLQSCPEQTPIRTLIVKAKQKLAYSQFFYASAALIAVVDGDWQQSLAWKHFVVRGVCNFEWQEIATFIPGLCEVIDF